MAFVPINHTKDKEVLLPMSTGETVVKGQVTVADTDGYYITGASSAEDIRYVALEGATTTADGQRVLHVETEGVRFLADTDAAPAQTDVGTCCDLADKSTLNPDASTNAQFYIEQIVGAVGDKKVKGFFTRGTINS